MSTGDGIGHLWEDTAPMNLMALYKSVSKYKYVKIIHILTLLLNDTQ